MAKQRSEQAQRTFAREQTTRQQAFTLRRDSSQRAHEMRMQEAKLTERDADRELDISDTANSLWNVGLNVPSVRESMELAIRNSNPALTNEAGSIQLDWSNPEQVKPLLRTWVRSGGGSLVSATAMGEQRSKGEEALAGMYGINNPSIRPYTNEVDLLKAKSTYASAQNKMVTFTQGVESLSAQLDELGKQQKLSPESYYEKSHALAQSTLQLAEQVDEFTGRPELAAFFAPGAGLVGSFEGFNTSLQSLQDNITTRQENKGVSNLAAWSPRNLDGAVFFKQGFGGGPNEGPYFEHMVGTEAFEAKAGEFNKVLGWLSLMSEADLAKAPEEVRNLRASYDALREKTPEGSDLGLRELVTQYRNTWHSEEVSGELLGRGTSATQIKNIVEGVARLDEINVSDSINKAKALDTSRITLQQASDFQLQRNNIAPIFTADEGNSDKFAQFLIGKGAVDSYGLAKWPVDEATQQQLLGQWYRSTEGTSQLLDSIQSKGLYGTPGEPVDNPVSQITELAKQVFRSNGITSPRALTDLQTAISARYPNQNAEITASLGLDEVVSPVAVLQPYQGLHADKSWVADQAPKKREEAKKTYIDAIFSRDTVLDPSVEDFTYQSIQPRNPFTQTGGFLGWFKSDDPKLKLRGEAAAEEGAPATLGDVFHYFIRHSPGIREIYGSRGRPSEQAYTPGVKAKVVEDIGMATTGGIRRDQPAEFASWAPEGSAAFSYIRGGDSFSRQYIQSVGGYGEGNVDNETRNQLEALDLIRGFRIADDPGAKRRDPGKVQLMLYMQDQLRGLDLGGALEALETGFPLDILLPEGGPVEDYPTGPIKLDSGEPSGNLDEARSQVIDNQSDLDKMFVGGYYDFNPDPELVAGDIMHEKMLSYLKKQQEEQLLDIDALERVNFNQITQSSRRTLANVLSGGADPITDRESLIARIQENIPVFTGTEQDLLALMTDRSSTFITRMEQSRSISEVIRHLMEYVRDTEVKREELKGIRIQGESPKARDITRTKITRNLATTRTEINYIAEGLMDRGRAEGKFNLESLPGHIQAAMEEQGLSKLLTDMEYNMDTAQLAAMLIWSANETTPYVD